MSSDTSSVQTGKNEVLGGIVTANGFFTGAVFLSVTGTVTPLSVIPSNCVAGDDISLNLFIFQVWSLGFYFLSSQIATAMKLVVIYYDTDRSDTAYEYDSSGSEEYQCLQEDPQTQEQQEEQVSSSGERSRADHWGKLAKLLALYMRSLMILSVVFSAVGSSFLLLSIIDLVQIKLGLLVVISVFGIAVLILLGLGVYLLVSWYFLKHVFFDKNALQHVHVQHSGCYLHCQMMFSRLIVSSFTLPCILSVFLFFFFECITTAVQQHPLCAGPTHVLLLTVTPLHSLTRQQSSSTHSTLVLVSIF